MPNVDDVIINLLIKNAEESAKKIEELEEKLEDYTEEGKEARKETDALSEGFEVMGVNTRGATQAIGKATKALGSLKVALATLGIGLVVGGILALKNAINTTQAAQDTWRRETAALGSVWDAITSDIGKATSELLGLEEVTEDTEKRQSFFGKALTFIGGALSTVNPKLGVYSQTLGAVANEGAQVEDELIKLEKSLDEFNLTQREGRLEIERFVASTRELGSSREENIQQIRRAIRRLDELEKKEQERLQTQRDQLEADRNATKNEIVRERLRREILQLDEQILNSQQQFSAQRRELFNRETEAVNALRLEEQKLFQQRREEFERDVSETAARLDEEIEARKEANKTQAQLDKGLRDLKKKRDKQDLKTQEQITKAEEKLAQDQFDFETQLIASSAEFASTALRALFGESKIAAVSEAIINTAAGVTLALRSGKPPLNFIQAATVAAQGLAQIRTIQSTNFGEGGTSAAITTPTGGFGGAINLPANNAQQISEESIALNQQLGLERAFEQNQPVLVTEDLTEVQNRVSVIEDRATS